jgi:hypothetical protein
MQERENENNVTTIKQVIKQALECKDIWKLDNGVCLCYSYCKDVEKPSENKKYVFVII